MKETLGCRLYHRKDPSQVRHLDGYNKLKPYGFYVHGCIDGYGRQDYGHM